MLPEFPCFGDSRNVEMIVDGGRLVGGKATVKVAVEHWFVNE